MRYRRYKRRYKKRKRTYKGKKMVPRSLREKIQRDLDIDRQKRFERKWGVMRSGRRFPRF